MAGNNDGSPGRSVTSKVVAVLDAFTAAAPEQSLNELAQRTGLPLSTTYRLATQLVDWGGLERAAGGGYRVGLRLWEIGLLASRGTTVRDVALPFMQDLYEATQENVHLAVLDGTEALYVERITGRHSVRVVSQRGRRMPLHATGVGKVLLAHAPREMLDELLEAGLKRYTPHTLVAPGPLRRALAEIRRTGVALSREEMSAGALSVASPVFDGGGTVAAALSIVVRSSRADLRRLGPAVRTAAIGVTRELRLRALDPPHLWAAVAAAR